MSPPRRIIEPRTTTDMMSLRQSGVATQHEMQSVSDKIIRSRARPPQMVKRVGFDVPTAGANQTFTLTSYVAVTGSEFGLNLGGPDTQSWSVDLTWAATFTAFGAAVDTVVIRPAVSWDGGTTWTAPDIDRSATQTVVQAYHTIALFRCQNAFDAITLVCRTVFAARGSELVRVRLEAKVLAALDTATLELTTAEQTPQCVGTAVAYEGSG